LPEFVILREIIIVTLYLFNNGHLSIRIKTGELGENGVKGDDWLIL
jgi:hypothetical protein